MTDTPQTKTTHTPGPWEADIYHGAHGNSVQIRARGKRRADVAQAYCDLSGGVTVAEQDANGHLLAAAPDLLAAVRSYISEVDYLIATEMHDNYTDRARARQRMGEAESAMRAAIAKAEGRQP